MRTFFVGEVVLFVFIYFFGGNGVNTAFQLRNECVVLENEIFELSDVVDGMRNKVASFEADDFYIEQIAREELQLARKGEIVYHTGNSQ